MRSADHSTVCFGESQTNLVLVDVVLVLPLPRAQVVAPTRSRCGETVGRAFHFLPPFPCAARATGSGRASRETSHFAPLRRSRATRPHRTSACQVRRCRRPREARVAPRCRRTGLLTSRHPVSSHSLLSQKPRHASAGWDGDRRPAVAQAAFKP